MITIKRTTSDDIDFRQLVEQLDAYLDESDKAVHCACEPFNRLDTIKHAVVAYLDNEPAGCGAIREYSPAQAEIKRMFTTAKARRQGVASMILFDLENLARELGFTECILETSAKLVEAVRLYQAKGYVRIANYGQYECMGSSVCFGKKVL